MFGFFSPATNPAAALSGRDWGMEAVPDLATKTTSLVGLADVPLTLANDGLGSFATTLLKSPISGSLWNSGTNRLELTGLPANSIVNLRVDYTITTLGANAEERLRLVFRGAGDAFSFNSDSGVYSHKSAGVYTNFHLMSFYIGSILNGSVEPQVVCDTNFTLILGGFLIQYFPA